MGRQDERYPLPPHDVPEGDLHIYTDGSAKFKNGKWRAGCGVWFGRQSPHNISTSPRGKQTNNRAELTAIILAIRKALNWETLFARLVVFSDSQLCVDGMKVWRHRWKLDGWTRRGQPLKNADLWKLVDRILQTAENSNFELVIRKVPAHVDIVGNEGADKLAGAAADLTHRVAARSTQDQQVTALDGMADAMVAAMTNDFQDRQAQADLEDDEDDEAQQDPLTWRWVPYHLRR